MQIQKPRQDLLNAQQTLKYLQEFLLQPGPETTPPCPGCVDHSAARCSNLCPDVKTALSIDPVNFPIENNVVPLVYGLMSTHMAQTCWSCEGHMDVNDNLIKTPRVSFYTSSPVYSQLLHRHLTKLMMDRKLAYPWHVILSDYAQTWGVTYSIVPDLTFVNQDVRLGQLQNDLKVISDQLQESMKVIAREMIIELDAWLGQQQAVGQA